MSYKYTSCVMPYAMIAHYLQKKMPPFEKHSQRISEGDFYIPEYNEYYLLFKYNYTVAQLKKICKHYKLPRTGKKDILAQYIYNFLELSCNVITIQKHTRGYLQRKENALRGPAYLEREKCVNDYDFFTLDNVKNISPTQFYSIKDHDGFIYGFDILSLWQLFEKNKESAENPYNRQRFPEKTMGVLTRLIKLNKKKSSKIDITLQNSIVDMEKQLELRIIDLFQVINTLGNYTNHEWFLVLDKQKIIQFCRELYDIWIHRAQITDETKRRICPNGNPFRNFQNTLHINNTQYELRKCAVEVSENLVYYGIDNDDKCLGAYYVLSALTLQNQEAAHALPWLYQSVM